MVTPDDTLNAVQNRFAGAIGDVSRFRGEVTAVIGQDALLDICGYMKDDLGYNFLSDLTCVDWLDREPRFDVVYHLTSLTDWIRFRLKVQVNEGESVPTVVPIWAAANWAEREVWDLFGVKFEGHPDLRRIQMPDGWIGHPLRKDYSQTQITLPRPKAEKAAPAGGYARPEQPQD
jgi:NADH-quinone oxidoreductase subunit C